MAEIRRGEWFRWKRKALQKSYFHQIIFSFILKDAQHSRILMAEISKLSYNITALQRGLRLLQLFSESSRGLTAKQVATLSRLPVSTVHRFVVNLERAGFLNWGGRRVPPGHCVFCYRTSRAGATGYSPRQPAVPPGTEPPDS
jgi:hypothetical protein